MNLPGHNRGRRIIGTRSERRGALRRKLRCRWLRLCRMVMLGRFELVSP